MWLLKGTERNLGGDRHVLCLDRIDVSILVVLIHSRPARCYHLGNCVWSTGHLSVAFLITRCESTVTTKLKVQLKKCA